MMLACGLALTAQTSTPPDSVGGWYSVAQATRGEEVYRRACASCHGDDLYGNPDAEVPALVDDEFLVPWGERTVRDLLTKIERTMPGNRPGSLQPAEARDVVAFLLRRNRFPSGDNDLPSDEALSRSRLARP